MHQRNVAHFDVKPANILIDQHGNIKIGDYGLARVVGAIGEEVLTDMLAASHAGTLVTGMGGTTGYLPPEILLGSIGDRIKPFKVDSYAMGIFLWALNSGLEPFQHLPPAADFAKVVMTLTISCRALLVDNAHAGHCM